MSGVAQLVVSPPRVPVRRRWWIALGPAGFGGLLLVAAILGFVVAIAGGGLGCLGGGSSAPGPAPSGAAVSDIPADYLHLYEQAGQRFDIDWTFLASIGAQESDHGRAPGTFTVNYAGAAGPMQICVRSCGEEWQRYAVDGNGDGTKSVMDPADAIFTAARILRFDKGAPPTGGSYQAYRQAACRYYGACVDAAANYAHEVMARAVQYGFHGQGSPPATNPTQAQPVAATGGGACAGAAAAGPADANAIVRVARSQLGEREQPDGSNCTKYGPCEAWCSLFLAWVWEHAGVPLPGGTAAYGYSGSIYTYIQSHGGTVLPPTARPAPGDAVFYGAGPSASVHAGIVEQVLPDGSITTIEGNFDNRVAHNGPFHPQAAATAGEPAPIFGYAQPPATKGRTA